VLYFTSAAELVAKTGRLQADTSLRQELARAACERVRGGRDTYQARLAHMLEISHES
jgi:hypothetical protein